jgi:hypothetical protein
MQNAVSANPNATAGAFAGAITILLVSAMGFAGATITAEVASAFTTVFTAVILWIGRRERPKPPAPALPDSAPSES